VTPPEQAPRASQPAQHLIGSDYRPDIDGLRALAVLAVVVYHALPWLCPGGFVGVDVFFVISGYLVTGIILKQGACGRYSVIDFYLRRAKRILPAQFCMLAVLLCVGWLLLTPLEYRNVGKLTAANAGFAANILLYRETGYFAAAAETNPLIHTWSLAVEEQFYLFWPLLLLAVLRSRRLVLALVIGIATASFAVACYLVVSNPSAAFYLLPGRAWELILGALPALRIVRAPGSPALRHALGVCGLALVVGSAFLLDHNSPFPAGNALWPCAGALLVILCGADRRSLSYALLSLTPLVWLGLISYSLYLWHWPVLVLARLANNAPLPDAVVVLLMLATVFVAWLSWRFVEAPFRHYREPRRARLLGAYAVASVVMLALSATLYALQGVPARVNAEVLTALKAGDDSNPLRAKCLLYLERSKPAFPGDECVHAVPGAAPTALLWGDSHADALAPGIAMVLNGRGRSVYQATAATCPPLLGLRASAPHLKPCAEYNRIIFDGIKARPDVRTVILSARWAYYAEASRFGDERGDLAIFTDDKSKAAGVEDTRRLVREALIRTTSALRAAGKTVIIIGQVPEAGLDVATCLARNGMPLSVNRPCAVAAAMSSERNAFTDDLVESADAPGSRVCGVLPSRFMCSEGQCRSFISGIPLYLDDDHLTSSGAKWLMNQIDLRGCM
jgi:peptidoglycan/LPS O-acetylase OafA/YrhL